MKNFISFKRLFNQDRDLKLSMIRREMITDTLQTGIKFFTYSLSGSQALKVDMLRSLLDVINHVFRISASFNSTYKPDDNYNYGYSRFRNITIMTPGYLFMVSGLYNMVSPTLWLASGCPPIHSLTLNAISLSAIGFASLGEFYTYYKNLGDVSDDKSLGAFKRISARTKLAFSVFNKSSSVGPVQDLVISENILSIASASIPIFTSVIAYSSGMLWVDLVGQFVNGGIQVFLGFGIAKENSQILMLKSLKKNDCERIVDIVLSRKEIEKVENLKSSWNIDQLRISAEIKLNRKVLAKTVLKMAEKDMKEVGVDQEEYRRFMMKFCYLLLGRSVEICKDTEQKIQEVCEFAHNMDIEKADSSNNPEKVKEATKAIEEVLREEGIYEIRNK